MKIFKYKIPEQTYNCGVTKVGAYGLIKIEMPEGAEPLSVQVLNGDVFIWAKVNPHAEIISKEFYIANTGGEIDYTLKKFIGTYQKDGFVWHLFEL